MDKKLEKKIRQLVKSITMKGAIREWKNITDGLEKPLFNYRYSHICQVVNTCKEISKGQNPREDILILSAWLHDIAKPGVGRRKTHGKMSADIAGNTLAEMGVEESRIRTIRDVISKHVGLSLDARLEPLEAQILWEADKLVKLGATGLVYLLLNGIMIEPNMTIERIAEKLGEYLPLAEEIADSMKHPISKQIARSRLEMISKFSEQLNSELLQLEVEQLEQSINGPLSVGVLTIGNEVLDGLVADTNANWIEKQIAELAMKMERVAKVRDNRKEIASGLKFLMTKCEFVVTSGGLGPTHDDMTNAAIASALNLDLREDKKALQIVRDRYQKLFQQGLVDSPSMTKSRRKMALIPDGAKALNNEVGGAPGVKVETDSTTIFCLPGVPEELKSIWKQSVEPWLRERMPNNYKEILVEFSIRDETIFAPHSQKVMNEMDYIWIKSMPKQYGKTDVLRVWISSRAENSITAEENVQRALEALEKSLGLESTRVES